MCLLCRLLRSPVPGAVLHVSSVVFHVPSAVLRVSSVAVLVLGVVFYVPSVLCYGQFGAAMPMGELNPDFEHSLQVDLCEECRSGQWM